jgi:hypothetical protein
MKSKMQNSQFARWFLIAAAFIFCSAFVQHYVEKRRVDAKLTWAEPQEKEALEVGFLALGGFRGLLVDVLWIKAQTAMASQRFYELKLLCDLIQKLQPTFTQVHSFQAHQMMYNMADKSEGAQDKWYWIQSGLAALERGLERTKQNYQLWFELGFRYFDRLGDIKIRECKEYRVRELPNIDLLTEDQRVSVFSKPKDWESGKARPDEYMRFAAYYFWKSIQTRTEVNPLRTERMYGQCLDRLGHWRAIKPVGEWTKWDDGGAEDWYVDLLHRYSEPEQDPGKTVPELLRWLMYEQMTYYTGLAQSARNAGKKDEVAENERLANDAYKRYCEYLPGDKLTMQESLKRYADHQAWLARITTAP